VKHPILIFFLVGLLVPVRGASQTSSYQNEIIRQLVAGDSPYAKLPLEFRFSTPNYAYVRDFVHSDSRDVLKVVSFDFISANSHSDGLSLKGSGCASVEGEKVTILDLSKCEIEWVFGTPSSDPRIYYSLIDAKRYSKASLLENLPNQSTDSAP